MRLVHYVIRADSMWCHFRRAQNSGDACYSPYSCHPYASGPLTQTTNSEVATKAGIRLPSSELAHMLQREAHRRAGCDDPHVALPTGAGWKHVQSSLSATSESASLSLAPVGTTPHTCPECGISYSSRATLLTHMTKRHPEQYRHLVPEPFNKTQDAVGGLPQCSHCRKKFATWQLHGNFFKDMSRAIIVQCGTHSCLNPPQTLCSLTWRGPRCSRKTRSRTALVGTLVMLYTTCLTGTAIGNTA